MADNWLRKGAELGNRGLSRRATEELLVEGNILLRDTDMDIRLGEPVDARACWRWWDMALLRRVAVRLQRPDSIFSLRVDRGRWDARLLARAMRRNAERMRDEYMRRMYAGVTVNLSHLASVAILRRLERGQATVRLAELRRTLYLAVKRIQRDAGVALHRGLRDPGAYGDLERGECPGLDQFLATATGMQLVDCDEERCTLAGKLIAEHEFDQVRLENLVEVYANEVAPIAGVGAAVEWAEAQCGKIAAPRLAALRFDDECIAHRLDRERYRRPRHAEINASVTATESGAPYLLLPDDRPPATAWLLVHGFLASPAELRGFGERVHARGHAVVGIRLAGHGTSPCDLRERRWQDWLASARRGFAIAAGLAPRVCVVGFSTGGALALCLAAERPAGLAGVAAAAVPVKFRDPGMMLVPLVHHANRLLRRLPRNDGVVPYQVNDSEHPDTDYRHLPIRGLYALRLLVAEPDQPLPRIPCPLALYQGDRDPAVVPESVDLIAARLAPDQVRVQRVASDRHGILNEDIGGVQRSIEEFVASC